MEQVDPTRLKGIWSALAAAAVAGAITIAVPATLANADPAPPTETNAPAPPPADPNAPPPPPVDPNAPPPPPVDPNAPPPEPGAPEPGRVDNVADGFSYVIPAGWVESDASHLEYGSALLSKETGEPPLPGQPPVVANDTRIVLGKLDQRLYASAESDNSKAATRLGSDMGEFFMPYPGTRTNQETIPLNGNGLTGSASYYEVKFSDAAKPTGQIWTGVVGTSAATPTAGAPTAGAPSQRWFVVWLGTANNPVDQVAAKALAESIRPLAPPPPAPGAAPAPGAPAPAPPAPGAPAPAPGAPAPAPAAPGAPAPAPPPAPAGTPT